jgi:RND family efflux transporter MFP subunit
MNHPQRGRAVAAMLAVGALLAGAAPGLADEGHRHPTAEAGPDPAHSHEAADAHHQDWWHRLQHWVIEALGGEHPHEASAHPHQATRESIVITDFTAQTELFVEFPPLIVNEPVEILVHLTRLTDFQPVTEGRVTVVLAGADGTEERFEVAEASRPGLFRVSVTPRRAGRHALRVSVAAPDLRATHALGEQSVHGERAAAAAERPAVDLADGGVHFLKEQQWRSDFATARVERRRLRGSVAATALLRPSADGEAHVTAPSAGRLTAAAGGFPYTGLAVSSGTVLAYLAPALGGEADVAGLELAVRRAESSLELARQERTRAEGLLAKQAVPERRVIEARSAEGVAEAELETARRRLAQVTGGAGGQGAGVPVRAPLAGTVAQVNVAPGSFVEQGERLFHLVDRSRLWLEARIAETDLAAIRQPQGAWFRVPGFDETFETGASGTSRLVAFGGMVDAVSRTVPIVFEFPNPDERLRVGLFVSARVYTGEEQEVLAVPRGAVVNDAGSDVVYVQRSGERFERRLVRTGLHDGEHVAVLEGLAAGERVVSRGAYLVHLAAGTPADAGHGHPH